MSSSGDDEGREWSKGDESWWNHRVVTQDQILAKAKLTGGPTHIAQMAYHVAQDDFCRVVGGRIYNPGLFFVILDEGWNCLEAFMNQLNTFYNLPQSNIEVWPGSLRPGFNVAVRATTHGNSSEMHRAKIVREEGDGFYFVYFWDYGDVRRVHISDIRYISKGHVKDLPAQAIPCVVLTGHTGTDSDCTHGNGCEEMKEEPMCSGTARSCNPPGALDTSLGAIHSTFYPKDRHESPPSCKGCDSVVWTREDKKVFMDLTDNKDIIAHFVKPIYIEDVGKGWEIYAHLADDKMKNKIASFHLEREILTSIRGLTFSMMDLRLRRLSTDTSPSVRLKTFPDVYMDYSRAASALVAAKFDDDDEPKYPRAADPNEVEEVKEMTDLEKKMEQWKSSNDYKKFVTHLYR